MKRPGKINRSMVTRVIAAAIFIYIMLPLSLHAEALTLKALIAETLKNSPRINEARYKWEASIERIPQADGLPDPTLSYTYFPEPIETRLGPNTSRLMLSQMLPYPGKLSTMADIAGSQVTVEEIGFQKVVRDVVTELSESYFEILYIQKAIKLTEQNKKVLDKLANIGAADYAADISTLNDVLAAQSQSAQLNYDLILLMELKESEASNMTSILNRPLNSSLGEFLDINIEIPYGIDKMYEMTATNLEEIRIIDAGIEKMRRAEELARLSSYPDFNVSVLYSMIDSPPGMQVANGGKDSYGITVGITLPIWSDKNSSAVREKTLLKKELIERKRARVNSANSNLKNLYFKMNNAKRLVALYSETLIPQAETTMAKAEEWYKKDNSNFSQFLETQSVWLNFNLALQRAAADYNKYAVRLLNLLGAELIYDTASKEVSQHE